MSATKTVSATGTYYYNEDSNEIFVTTGTVVTVVFSGEKIYFNTAPVSTDYITVSISPDSTSSSNTATQITVTYTCEGYSSNEATYVNAVVVDSDDNSGAQINVIAVEDPSSYKSSSSSIFDSITSDGYITLSVGDTKTYELLSNASDSDYIYLAQIEKAYTYSDGELTSVDIADSADNGYANLDTIIALYTKISGTSYDGIHGYAYTDSELGYGDLKITAAGSITDSSGNTAGGVAVIKVSLNPTTSSSSVGGHLTVYVKNGSTSFFPLTVTSNPVIEGYSTAASETVTITYSNFLNRPVEYFYSNKDLGIGTTYTAYVTLTDTSGNTSTLIVTGQEEITISDTTYYAFTFDDNVTLVGNTYESVSITITAVSTAASFSVVPGTPTFLVNMVVSEYEDESTSLVYCGTTGSKYVYLNHTQSGYYSDIHAEISSDSDTELSATSGTVTTEVVYDSTNYDETDTTEPYTLLESVDWELATEDDDLSDLISVSLDSDTGIITVTKTTSGSTVHDANTLILTLTWNASYSGNYSDDITASVDSSATVVYTQTIEIPISANELLSQGDITATDSTKFDITYTNTEGESVTLDTVSWSEASSTTNTLTIADGTAVEIQTGGWWRITSSNTYTSGTESVIEDYLLSANITNVAHEDEDESCGFTVTEYINGLTDKNVVCKRLYTIQDNATGKNSCTFTFEIDEDVMEVVRVEDLSDMATTCSFTIITSSSETPSYVVISDLTDLENATVNTLRDDYSDWSFAEEFTSNPSTPTAFYKDVTTGSSTTQIVVFYIPEDYTVYTTQWEDGSELTEGTSTDNDDPLFLLVSEGTIRALSLPCGTDTTDERTFTITSGDIDGTCTLVVKRVEALSDYE